MKKLFLFIMLFSLKNNISAQWVQKANIPLQRHGAVAAAVGTKFYVGLGNSGSTMLNDLWEYDPTTNNWNQLQNFPGTPRKYSVSFVIGNDIYVGTGIDNTFTMKKDFFKYSVLSNTWTAIPNYPGNSTKEGYSFALNNKGYVGGGTSVNGTYEYNPSTNTWTSVAASYPGPNAVEGAAVFVLSNEAYVVGGSGTSFTNGVYKFNGTTWSTMANLPVASGVMSAVGFTMNNKGYIALGHDGVGYVNNVYEYNATTNTWTTSVAYPGQGRDNAVAVYNSNNMVYVGTGYYPSGSAQDWWTFSNSTDIQSLQSGNNNVIFPNPASQFINIQVNNNEQLKLEIYTVMGEKIMDQILSMGLNKISINQFTSGVYTFRLIDINGISKTNKILIE